MRQKTGTYFICKVKYEKVMEDGLVKVVTEQYVVEAMSFAEAEARITEEMQAYVYARGEFSVEDISKAQFKEIFFTDADTDDKWYKAKLAFITIDEVSGKEKRSNYSYLVQASKLDGALRNINEVMSTSMSDFDSLAVQETSILEVYEHGE